jgi:hypothetical protein
MHLFFPKRDRSDGGQSLACGRELRSADADLGDRGGVAEFISPIKGAAPDGMLNSGVRYKPSRPFLQSGGGGAVLVEGMRLGRSFALPAKHFARNQG